MGKARGICDVVKRTAAFLLPCAEQPGSGPRLAVKLFNNVQLRADDAPSAPEERSSSTIRLRGFK